MVVLFWVVLITLVLLVLLYVLSFVISLKKSELLKVSTFESGFVSLSKVQNSFSIHFFVIMLMFVIFDLEIVMFLGLVLSDFSAFVGFFMLMFFIMMGFYMEWWYGKLIWVI
uniref:NADH-ubiquinone oxidoreductase chain 3 n=1 Tax=Cooperia oncophora TaxID=27828 RepID=Q85HP7_COOON|nr:NADH dehydrogenase subunit 3 [Cooperia oncophora]AAO91762.1 NADH dehydrogenase subunit 3 [Cooperia oncophora]